MAASSELTVVIPTRNRSHLVRNQIEHYAGVGFPFKIIYIDASDEDQYQANKAALALRAEKLSCEIWRANPSPQRNPARRINDQFRDYIDRIDTPFVCQSGDDDFFFESGVRAAFVELQAHPELSSCGGSCILVETDKPTRLQTVGGQGRLSVMPTIFSELEDPYIRVRNNIAHFSNATYYVSRYEIWRKCYFDFSEENLESGLVEQLMCAVLLANGKVRRLDRPLVLRHLHAKNNDEGRRDLSYDVLDPEFFPRMEHFCAQVERVLRRTGADLPSYWYDEIRHGFLSMSLSTLAREYSRRVTAWYEPHPSRGVPDLVRGDVEKQTLYAMLRKVADNTLVGLVDPRTSSFHREGLGGASLVG
jgi:glycosyltransferase domain-containing protein